MKSQKTSVLGAKDQYYEVTSEKSRKIGKFRMSSFWRTIKKGFLR